MPKILGFLSQPNKCYSGLIKQLEAIIVEISKIQVLRLRTNLQRMQIGPTVKQDFTVASYLVLADMPTTLFNSLPTVAILHE